MPEPPPLQRAIDGRAASRHSPIVEPESDAMSPRRIARPLSRAALYEAGRIADEPTPWGPPRQRFVIHRRPPWHARLSLRARFGLGGLALVLQMLFFAWLSS